MFHPSPSTRTLYVLGTLLVVLNACIYAVNLVALRRATPKSLREYSYVGNDYPDYYPISLDTVELTPENSVHYQIYAKDAAAEWKTVYPEGGGFVFLGPERRPFGLALFHQHHCLERIRAAMSERRDSEHVRHCFAYMRQTILCEASPVIEPVVPILGRRSVNAEVPRMCRDWTQVYALAAASFRAGTGATRKG